MTAVDRYFDVLAERLDLLRRTSSAAIEAAAEACASTLRAKGTIHVFDTGHLVSDEFFTRAGGLAAVVPLRIAMTVDDPHPTRAVDTSAVEATIPELVTAALGRSRLRPGDVLVVASTSGTAALPVELCQRASAHGVTTIALTAIEYSIRLDPRHPSGVRLADVGDIVIDSAAPYGDGMLRLDGLDHPACPFSGIGAVAALWAVEARAIELAAADGMPPTIYPSVNLPNGVELVEGARERYAALGF